MLNAIMTTPIVRYGRRTSKGSLSLLPPCKPDSTSLLGQIGSLFDRVGRRVHNYMIYRQFLTMTRWIFGTESIFLPAFPVLQGRTDRSRGAGDGGAAPGYRCPKYGACEFPHFALLCRATQDGVNPEPAIKEAHIREDSQ
jgi:hypothetical protein